MWMRRISTYCLNSND
jgi:hypothetical protein